MPEPHGPLGAYIDARRRELGLSWRRLSYKAGLSPETVTMLVVREGVSQPRAETLRAIAKALNVPYEKLLILAGHMDPPREGKPSPEVARLISQILEIYQDIKDNPQAVAELVNLVSTSAETVRTLAQHEHKQQPA
jgi:transcriptional regulator with XRE-family HTH domain